MSIFLALAEEIAEAVRNRTKYVKKKEKDIIELRELMNETEEDQKISRDIKEIRKNKQEQNRKERNRKVTESKKLKNYQTLVQMKRYTNTYLDKEVSCLLFIHKINLKSYYTER